ncbi:MAG: MoaD/ThiS family protein [Negativicutes bacterium]|nr:MoaD/ThiS family protein [Negativicutes bacterium]
MSNESIEVRGFGKLAELFRERKWSFPLEVPLAEPVTGYALLAKLEIAADQVEAIFINGKAGQPDKIIRPGDRVALVPPGTPGPYRVLLGFVSRKQPPENEES